MSNERRTIAFGSDHAGFAHRQKIFEFLKSYGYNVIDCGCFKSDNCDYPDYAIPVAKYISKGIAERGILLCGTGIGMSIVANKFRNVRAAVCYSNETAALASKHNNANILCIGGRFFNTDQIVRFIQIWLETPFEGDLGVERHQRRLDKIRRFEERFIKKQK